MRVLGLPIETPQAAVNRILSDLGAVARTARDAHVQLDRLLELGEEMAAIGRAVLEIAERLDARAASILDLGDRLDGRARAILDLGERLDARAEAILTAGAQLDRRGAALIELGERLDGRGESIVGQGDRLDARGTELVDLGIQMQALGDRVDARGAEVADQAAAVVETATELIAVLPTLERALQMATPLEGAIDRFGRLVDRLPGGRRPDAGAPQPPAPLPAGRPPRPQ